MSLNLISQLGIRKHLVPDSLTHSSGIITAIFGSKVYQTILSGLTANTRYQLYLIPNGTMVFSANENSVGPSGQTSWLLVGSFYSNGVGSVGFGAFIKDVASNPESETWDWTPSGGWTSNVGYFGKARRNKEFLEAEIYMVCSGVPSPAVQQFFSNPINLLTDTAKLPNGVSNFYVCGGWTGQDSGVSSRGGIVQLLGGVMYPYWFAGGTSTIDGVQTTTPFSWNNLDAMTATVKIPIVGWSATAIKDL